MGSGPATRHPLPLCASRSSLRLACCPGVWSGWCVGLLDGDPFDHVCSQMLHVKNIGVMPQQRLCCLPQPFVGALGVRDGRKFVFEGLEHSHNRQSFDILMNVYVECLIRPHAIDGDVKFVPQRSPVISARIRNVDLP